MGNLISFAQQQLIRKISDNNQRKFDIISGEVEEYEIDKLLGSQLYQLVKTNQTTYSDLLNETEFERSDGTTIKHKGLIYVIAYLVYAQYVMESDVADTFSGMVNKNLPNSQALSTGRIKELNQRYREIAFNAFVLIKEYLDIKSATEDKYSLWNSHASKRINKPKFYGIKSTKL